MANQWVVTVTVLDSGAAGAEPKVIKIGYDDETELMAAVKDWANLHSGIAHARMEELHRIKERTPNAPAASYSGRHITVSTKTARPDATVQHEGTETFRDVTDAVSSYFSKALADLEQKHGKKKVH